MIVFAFDRAIGWGWISDGIYPAAQDRRLLGGGMESR